jgi:hypothetical protein
MKSPVRATLDYLRLCVAARNAGMRVSYTTDARWLVHMAINRRAGWPDDPTEYRGSCMPNAGGSTLPIGLRYPRKAAGAAFGHLWLIAREINTPRLVVTAQRLGEWRALLESRLPHRIDSGVWSC